MIKIINIFFILSLSLFVSATAVAKNKEPKFIEKGGYKSITYGGIIYKGKSNVSDKAFQRARLVVDTMLEKIPYVRTRLTEMSYKIVIIAADQKLTDIPEYEYFKGKQAHQRIIGKTRSFDTQVPGMAEYEMCAVSEDGLTKSRVEDILVHEMAHAILFHMYKEDGDLIQKIYTNAYEKHLFPSRAYLMNNYQEYWAVMTTAWFGVAKDYTGNGGVNSAEKVKARDPKIAAFLEQIYGTNTIEPIKD